MTGANGAFGHCIIPKLVARGASVRAFVSNPESAARVAALGAEPFVGDLRNPGDLHRAAMGIAAFYHLCPALQHDEHAIGSAAIEAARRAGVRHFVYHSLPFPFLEDILFHWEKMRLQVSLMESGLAFTIMQPTNLMQNISWVWPRILRDGEFPYPYSVDQELTWVDLEDVGAACAEVLTSPGHHYATYELASPDGPLSRRRMAAIIESVIGRPVRATEITFEEMLSVPRFQRLSTDEQARLHSMFRHYDAHGFRCGSARTLEMLIGRAATPYRTFVERLHRNGRVSITLRHLDARV